MSDAAQDQQAMLLRCRGAGYSQIAQALGYDDALAAQEAAQRALADAPRDAQVDALVMALARVDVLDREAFAVLTRTHLMVSNGRLMRDDDKQPLQDDGPRLAAMSQLLRNNEARMKLLLAIERADGKREDDLDSFLRSLSSPMGDAEV